MDCKNFIESFLELDNAEALPPGLAEHRKNCAGAAHGKNCAKISEDFRLLLESRAAYGDIPPARDITAAVMARVAGAAIRAESRRDISMTNWVCAGLLIFTGMCLIPFSTILPGLVMETPWLSIALPLVLGSVITIYAMIFTCSNMKTLSRLLRHEPRI